jgi:hypothetical protein
VNLSSSVVIAFGLLLVTAVVVGTFDHKYDYTRRMFKQSFEELPVAFSDIKNLKGTLVSLQYNGSHAPAWILTGRWKISDSDVSNNDNSILKFTANKHRLINFKLLNLSFSGSSATLRGTISFTTSGTDPTGISTPILNLPITIKIENLRTMNLDIDKKLVKYHFGESPIYGAVSGTSID